MWFFVGFVETEGKQRERKRRPLKRGISFDFLREALRACVCACAYTFKFRLFHVKITLKFSFFFVFTAFRNNYVVHCGGRLVKMRKINGGGGGERRWIFPEEGVASHCALIIDSILPGLFLCGSVRFPEGRQPFPPGRLQPGGEGEQGAVPAPQ